MLVKKLFFACFRLNILLYIDSLLKIANISRVIMHEIQIISHITPGGYTRDEFALVRVLGGYIREGAIDPGGAIHEVLQ